MILTGGRVMGADMVLRPMDLRIEQGRIAQMGEGLTGGDRLELSGMLVLPGFIDTHIHGACGTRISDDDADLERISAFEASQGVTGLAITTASSEFSHILRQLELAAAWAGRVSGAKLLAVHAEGPFLSRRYKGAMSEEFIIPARRELLDEMVERAGGLLRILTLAPEAGGAAELIPYAVGRGLRVSMGHTDATYDQAMAAIAAGASRMTHTFNASRPLHHREAGVLGAALTDPRVCCEMICDHVHLHPAALELIRRVKGPGNICMVSDSGHAAGLAMDRFTVDGQTRYVVDGVVRLADGTIAGSARTLLDGVRNLLGAGVPLPEVCRMASVNPARQLGLETETGTLAPGLAADLVVLDGDLAPRYTFVDGRCAYSAG